MDADTAMDTWVGPFGISANKKVNGALPPDAPYQFAGAYDYVS